jgi:hypothetical protein
LPRTVTSTVAIITADTDITFSTSDAARLQVGHLLISLDSVEEIVRVITPGATTVGVTRTFGSVAADSHVDTTSWRVMSPVFADGATFVQSPSSLGEFTTFRPFIIQYQDNMTPIRSASRSYMEKNRDPLEFRLERLKRERLPELEALLLHSDTSTISSTVAGAPAGIRPLIATNVTAVSGVLTATIIENMLDTLYGWDGRRKITVLGNRTMHRIWNAVWRQFFDKQGEVTNTPRIGFAVTVYQSPTMGDVEFMVCDACKDSELLFLDKSSWELHPLDWKYGSGWHTFERGVKETNALGFATGMYYAGLLAVSDERLNGKLTGITTTLSSYSGAV